jgi:catechol 2,3-dioxygenase-like lactoylglutathione lyase family enzyme
MLVDGFNHVAVLTADTERFVEFYGAMFGATVLGTPGDLPPGWRLTFVGIGDTAELNVFQIDGNDETARQTPMFGRGRLDHLALQAASLESFDEARRRLVERGASDGFVTDFGPMLSLFFVDPDGLECEICVANPDAIPGTLNPPGTPAARYHGDR